MKYNNYKFLTLIEYLRLTCTPVTIKHLKICLKTTKDKKQKKVLKERIITLQKEYNFIKKELKSKEGIYVL